MQLKSRLKMIADMIPIGSKVCDIGTDHAYLPIYLVKKGICQKVIACDVTIGPVEVAKKNVEQRKLAANIEVRLGYGLEPISKGEADVIIIAGMGGILTKEILSRDMDKVIGAKRLILQPMSDAETLREYLYLNGFDIIDESLAAEGEKLYNIITAVWTGIAARLDKIHYLIGLRLVEKKDPLLGRLIKKKIKYMEKAIMEIKMSGLKDVETEEKKTFFEEMIIELKKIEIFVENKQ
jgi:tRNA (adenine22-N1)-methyltransferase